MSKISDAVSCAPNLQRRDGVVKGLGCTCRHVTPSTSAGQTSTSAAAPRWLSHTSSGFPPPPSPRPRSASFEGFTATFLRSIAATSPGSMPGHQRAKNVDYDDDEMYSDEDYDEGAEGDGMTDEDREQMRIGTINVRKELGPGVKVTDAQIQEALWHYYYDVAKSVSYIKSTVGMVSTNRPY